MKYFFFGIALILLSSCNKLGKIEFDGSTTGIKTGTFIIKNLRDSTLYGVIIKDGKFQTSGILPESGYYTMVIVDDADKASYDKHYEVYLEKGKFTIETDPKTPYNYPKISSESKIQADLSAYYSLLDKQQTDDTKQIDAVKAKINEVSHRKHNTTERNELITKLEALQNNENGFEFEALKLFAKQYPQSTISAHLMSGEAYETKPVEYYELFKTFSPEAKNSDEGKEIGTKLAALVKLQPGAQSPALVGNTPDGKPFDPKSIKKKVILIDFWRAVNQVSRLNHPQMQTLLDFDFKGSDKFGIVSVSIDSKKDWWQTAITEDKMTWTQVSDLKGDDSQNAANWAVTQIPTYYLVDANWKIIARDIQLREIPVYVNEYLEKH